MVLFDVRCGNCRHLNRNLLLEDSDGWMECEACGCISRVRFRIHERKGISLQITPERNMSKNELEALSGA